MMSSTVLQDAFDAMEPFATEEEAITALVDAYGLFAADATANGVPLLTLGLEAGKAAMAFALIDMNEEGAGLVKIPLGIVAFWEAVASGLSSSFAGATAIVPPPHAGFAESFASVAATNVETEASKEDASAIITFLLYSNAIIGGAVTFTTPVFPIL